MANLSFDDLVAAVQTAAPTGGPIAQLEAAATISAALADTADALLTHFVELCRTNGHSWSQIGAALGVTKQAAQKRFVDSSLERVTPRARRVLDAARVIADDQGASTLRLDHLALALFSQPEALAARVLTELGVEEEALDEAMTRRTHARGVKLSDTPPVDQTVLATALALGHNYIGTEHMLLACHRDPSSPTARALNDLGATEPKLRAHIVAALTKLTGS